MLFNSFPFILAFLPVTLLGFYLLGERGHRSGALVWLVFCSLFFYGWWNPRYLALILGSIAFNYGVGIWLEKWGHSGRKKRTGWLLALGILANLIVLGYFKYSLFFLENLNLILDNRFHIEAIILPLGISFFTFQQIAWLTDIHRGGKIQGHFLHYSFFVVFFPQLIAGPIVRHKEMVHQYQNPAFTRLDPTNLSLGLTLFFIGLYKKVAIADRLAPFVDPLFLAAEAGHALNFTDAWLAGLGFGCQIYFDFSAYSDMAMGLAALFNLRLPVNFNSPFKACNIVQFWQRWHITLSRFLAHYLFAPIALTMHRLAERLAVGGWGRFWLTVQVPLLVTFLLSGLWHGAGWTFICWGGLHGLYLIIHNLWSAWRERWGNKTRLSWLGELAARLLAQGMTFAAITVAWILFRAESLGGAGVMLRAMAGQSGFQADRIDFPAGGLVVVLLLITWLAPNALELTRRYQPALENHRGEIRQFAPVVWRPSAFSGLVLSLLAFLGLLYLFVWTRDEFIYFQF
ncbi:MAG: MBOAT family protein [Magnetococcales bacterium]|nr:MBOAT family protein [Magnetococcales bacterium]